MPENRARETQSWALGFSRNRRNSHGAKNLPAPLPIEEVANKLSVGRKIKKEMPVHGRGRNT